ncbi:MAG: immunoglobulin domain-containing protein [Planctomycetota bacterium]
MRPTRCLRLSALVAFGCLAICQLAAATDDNRATADSYDNAWKNAWVTHLRNILAAQSSTHTGGFVIHVGDSITYSNAYSMYATQYSGSNANDLAAIAFSKANGTAPDIYTDVVAGNDKNGWNLAKYDHPAGGRSYTASSGITSGQWLVGGGSHGMASGNGSTSDPTPMDTLLNNNTITPYSSGEVVAIVHDAQVCVMMLGTNDIDTSVTTATSKANLQSLIDKLQAKNIMVVLSTIPPNSAQNAAAIALNTEIANLAQTNSLPLIDFYAEIVRRQPVPTCFGTLINAAPPTSDGTHPTGGAYLDPDTDPAVLDNNGYELRGFLTIQKLWEVKHYVIDGVNPPGFGPTIGTQPSNVSVMVGQPASFSVAATGTGTLHYQWMHGTTAVGTDSSTFSIGSTVSGDAGSYSVIVTDDDGSTTSNTVTLTVTTPAPTITTQPSPVTVFATQSATFTVVAGGTGPFTYQWHKGATLVGTNSASFTIGSTTTADTGSYYVVVSNAGGSVTSSTVTLTVNGAPTITAQPSSISVVQTNTATFSVTASGTGLTYQWQLNSANIGGATAASYTTPATVLGDSGEQFRVIVTNPAGTATSNQATLTVTATAVAPTIVTPPASQTVTAGGTATFSVVAAGTAPFTYQWQKNGSAIGGATSQSYTTPTLSLSDSGELYSVVVTNAGGSTPSSAATLTVVPGVNPVVLSVTALSFGAPTGSTTTILTPVLVTNTSGSTVTVTATATVSWVTPGGTVTIPAGDSVTIQVAANPSGMTGVSSGTVSFASSAGGTTTVPVSLTVGSSAGLQKRSCAIGSGLNPDTLMWIVGLLGLAMLSARARKQTVRCAA